MKQHPLIITVLFTVLCSAFLTACHNPPDPNQPINPDSAKANAFNKPAKPSPAAPIDSFKIADKKFTVFIASDSDFLKIGIPIPDTSEKRNLAINKDVKRKKDSLIFTTPDKIKLKLVNNNADNEQLVNYRYWGFKNDLGQHLVFASYYEGYSYILVDKNTDDTTRTIGMPVPSPDNKYFICGNSDLVAAFTPNGIELYENTGGKPKRLGSVELTKWGPESIIWADDHTLLIKRSILDANGVDEKTDFVKIVIS